MLVTCEALGLSSEGNNKDFLINIFSLEKENAMLGYCCIL